MIVFSLFHSRQEKNKLNLFFSYIYIQKMFPSGEQKSYLRICSIEIKRSENNLIIYQYNTYIRTYAESVNRFLCSIYKIESSNKCVCVCVCDTNGRSSGQHSGVFTLNGNPMAFALYYWKKEKDRHKANKRRRRKRSGGHPSKLTNVYFLILSLSGVRWPSACLYSTT